MSVNKTVVQFVSAAAFVVTGLVTGPAHSQSVGDEEMAIEEIVVTVRKREESLLNVPISITTKTWGEMVEAGIEDIFDIAAFTPNLAFQDFGNGQLGIPTIRGMGQTNVFDEKNVGIFVNGIYISDENAFDIDMLDIARVEVARGPQSSLYGRNSFAGAINFVPGLATDEFAGRILGSVGTDEYYELQGVVGGPIGDRFGIRAAAGYKTFDGTFDNPANPSDNLQGWETWNVSTALNWQITDDLKTQLFAYYLDDQNEQTANYLLDNNCGDFLIAPPGPPGQPPISSGEPAYFCGDLPFKEDSELGVNGSGISPEAFGAQREALIASLDFEWNIDRWTLSWLTGLVDSDNNMSFDSDMSNGYPFATGDMPFCPFPTAPPFLCAGPQTSTLLTDEFTTFINETEDWSSEFRVAFDGDRYRAMLGLFWYDHELSRKAFPGVDENGSKEMMPAGFDFTNPGANLLAVSDPLAVGDPVNGPLQSVGTVQTTEDISIFGSFEYDFSDRWSLTVEGRYTEEEKAIEREPGFFGGASTDKDDWDFFTPRFTLEYSPANDGNSYQWMTYASIAKGVHAGGFNVAFDPTVPSESKFDPDENWTYEVGYKGSFVPYGDALMNLSFAAFYTDWTDVQMSTLTRGGGTTNPIQNVGDAEVWGLELILNSTLSRYFDLNIGYGYADPELTAGSESRLGLFCGPDIPGCQIDPATGAWQFDVVGQQLGRTHKHQFNASGILHGPLGMNWGGGGWEWYARADYSYLSEAPSRLMNVQFIPERSLVNMRAAIRNEAWELALWARNLFDEGYVTGQSQEPRQTNQGDGAFFSLRTTAGYQGDGRIVGASAIWSF